MVINGGARSGASDLAAHLQRIDTNDEMYVLEMRGVVADDLDGALSDMEAVSAGACSRRPLYHANINTAPDEGLSVEQKHRAVDRLEIELGLIGQPRAVVEHVKHGRAHLHVVWLRVDLYTMEAIPDGHNYRKHELVARELEREFGHNLVQGAHIGREGVERPKRTPSAAEMLQAERSGMSPQEATARVTELWRTTDGGKAFAAALNEAGFVLARGDARDFVLIDSAGETHSLGRRIEGVKAAAVRQRMGDLNAAELPNVEEARKQVRDRWQASEAEPVQPEDLSVSKPNVTTSLENQAPDAAAPPVTQDEVAATEASSPPSSTEEPAIAAPVNAPTAAVEAPPAVTEQGVHQTQPPEEDASVSASEPARAAPRGEGQLSWFRAAFSQMMEKILSWFQRGKTPDSAASTEKMRDPPSVSPLLNFSETLGKPAPAPSSGPDTTSALSPVQRPARESAPAAECRDGRPAHATAPPPDAEEVKARARQERARQLASELLRKWQIVQPPTKGPSR